MTESPARMTSALRTASASDRDQRPSDRPPEGEAHKRQKLLRFSLAPASVMDQPEWERRIERFTNAVVRGAGAGFCLRGGLNLVRPILLPVQMPDTSIMHDINMSTGKPAPYSKQLLPLPLGPDEKYKPHLLNHRRHCCLPCWRGGSRRSAPSEAAWQSSFVTRCGERRAP